MAKKSHAVAVLEARLHAASQEVQTLSTAYSAALGRVTELQTILDQVRTAKPASTASRKPRKDKGTVRKPTSFKETAAEQSAVLRAASREFQDAVVDQAAFGNDSSSPT